MPGLGGRVFSSDSPNRGERMGAQISVLVPHILDKARRSTMLLSESFNIQLKGLWRHARHTHAHATLESSVSCSQTANYPNKSTRDETLICLCYLLRFIATDL